MRIALLLPFALSFLAACNGSESGEDVDASIVDGATDGLLGDAEVADLGPPPQYCPDDLVRFVADEQMPGSSPFIALASVGTFDVVLAQASLIRSRVPFLIAYVHERSTGRIERHDGITDALAPWVAAGGDRLRLLTDRTVSNATTGAFFLHTDHIDSTILRVSLRDDGGELTWGVESTNDFEASLTALSAEQGIAARGEQILHWHWPFGGDVTTRATALTLATNQTAGLMRVARRRDGNIVVFLPRSSGVSTGPIVVYVLDSEAQHILNTFETTPANPGPAFASPYDNSVFLAVELDGRRPAIWHVGEGVEPWVELNVAVHQAAFDEDALVVLGPAWDNIYGGLSVGRVRLDRPSVEGAFRPVVGGLGHLARIVAPPGGGAVVASTCFESSTVDLTYFCSPEVPRD